MGILQARILEWVAMPFSRGLIATGGSINLLCLEGFPHLPGAPQHEARLMRSEERRVGKEC